VEESGSLQLPRRGVILEQLGITHVACNVSTDRWWLTSIILKMLAPRLASTMQARDVAHKFKAARFSRSRS
jgi:hypothetical protein